MGPLFVAEAVGVVRYDAYGVVTPAGSFVVGQPTAGAGSAAG
ncbi:MAG TPA: hypothetical protein VMC83_08700 [Streptosporangiaceae bacterium]|nr:hypothetical protein [Streptosporangiaceae bacterium]